MIAFAREDAQDRKRRRIARSDAYRRTEAGIRARLLEVTGHMPIATLAEEIGLNRESVRRALRNGMVPLELVWRICSHFQVSADWVLYGDPGSDGARPQSNSTRASGPSAAPEPGEPPSSARAAPGAQRLTSRA